MNDRQACTQTKEAEKASREEETEASDHFAKEKPKLAYLCHAHLETESACAYCFHGQQVETLDHQPFPKLVVISCLWSVNSGVSGTSVQLR